MPLGAINGNTAGAGFGDAQWFGLSQGGGIADPGQTAFSSGGGGGPGNCFYEYVDGTVAPVLPPSIAGGMTTLLSFSPDGMGGYIWIGL